MPFTWYHPVRVYFGNNSVEELRNIGLNYPVAIVTGKTSAIKRGIVDRLREILGRDVLVYNEIGSEPTFRDVERLKSFLMENDIKTIIAVGGGSVLDSAKLAGLLVNNPEVNLRDIIGVRNVDFANPPIDVIAIPTTSGSGSEATPYSIVIDREALKKASVGSIYLYPKIAIDDPTLTHNTPYEITRNSGIDAFSHCLEILFMRDLHPVAFNFSINGMALFVRFFKNALKDDPIAREKMMLCSLYGGYSISNVGAGLIHQFAHAIGVLRGYPHGYSIALYTIPVLSFYFNSRDGLDRIRMIEEQLGLKGFIFYLRRLFDEIGIPYVRELGLSSDEVETIVGIVERRRPYFDKFVAIPSRDDLYRIALDDFTELY